VASELVDFVRRARVGIVVMGAVSRSAMARLFIGNTAERVLDHVGCDVLIVKPRGFRSKIAVGASAGARARRARAAAARRSSVSAVAPYLGW